MRQIVQTLVVVLILATLAGLVLPALGRVRESGRRTECANNLRHIGDGIGNYQSTYGGRYPAAALPCLEVPSDNGPYSFSTALNPVPPENRLSLLVELVPYIDQDNIYNRLDKTQSWDAEINRFAALLSCKLFHCPSYPEGPPASTLWPSHYVGISGVGEDAAWFP